MVKKIHAMSYFSAFGGYANHAKYLFEALGKLTEVVRNNRFINEPITCFDADANIVLSFPGEFELLKQFGGKKIGCCVFEGTKLDPKFIETVNSLDQFWIPTNWGKEVLLQNGANENKIKVVPEGVDPALFNPERTPQLAITKIPGFKFLCVGRLDLRKNLPILVQAFDEEFHDTPDVSLVMAAAQCNLRPFAKKNPSKILHVNPVEHHTSLARLYTSCHAFVLPTKTEGWGLPIIEAMACGLPVIVPKHSGHTDFVKEEEAYFINHKLVDIDEAPPVIPEGVLDPALRRIYDLQTQYNPIGQWAAPDFNHLKHQMRYVFEHQEEAKEKGMIASKDVRSNWTWDLAAKIGYEEVKKLI